MEGCRESIQSKPAIKPGRKTLHYERDRRVSKGDAGLYSDQRAALLVSGLSKIIIVTRSNTEVTASMFLH